MINAQYFVRALTTSEAVKLAWIRVINASLLERYEIRLHG